MRYSLTSKFSGPLVAFALGVAAASIAAPASAAEQIWPNGGAHHGGGAHSGGREGGWSRQGGFNHAYRGGNWNRGGFGGYALGLGALGAFDGYRAYYNGDCVQYRSLYNAYGRYVGRRAVRVC